MVHILYDIGEYNVGYDISAFLMLTVLLIFRLLQIKIKSHSMHLLITNTILLAITQPAGSFFLCNEKQPSSIFTGNRKADKSLRIYIEYHFNFLCCSVHLKSYRRK